MAARMPYLRDECVFGPDTIEAMSTAFEQVCIDLKLGDDAKARETVAVRIIDLARGGEKSAETLRDRVLHEANLGESV